MLFEEILERLRPEVEEAVAELFQTIYRNLDHPQDLLLTEIGQFTEIDNGFGPGLGGWDHEAEHTQYEFYDMYRKAFLANESRKETFDKAEKDPDVAKAIRQTIQFEMMVYLRFWEADRILKKLYHYTQLALGQPFNWQYTIGPDDSRQELIRLQIRDPLQSTCPKYYNLLKSIYRSQVRNAVAHSQFYITDNSIGFTNYDPKRHAPHTQERYPWWEEIFHRVVLFYNELLRHQRRLNDRAKRQDALALGRGLEIRCTNPSQNFTKAVHWTFNHKRGIWDWVAPPAN
ncbi:MAG: hypothetical protein IPJ85_15260 [Flavobacteriales bacterium]|nr:hypothetical protein [Flavobacteriales bacterium]